MKTMEPRIVRGMSLPAGTPDVPVCIVGAGACGLTAAIRLRDVGIDCVVLERDAVPSGSSALSSGFIPAAQTRLQKSLGIADSHALLAQDIQNKAHDQAPEHLVQAYVHAATDAIDALQAHGLPFEIVRGFLYPGHTVERLHSMPERTGAALMARLNQLATDLGADILGEALVRELWLDAEDRVTGVGYQRPDGTIEHLGCKQLVLACNGFGGNPQMVRELIPEMGDASFGGHVGNDGSATPLGAPAGAADGGSGRLPGPWVLGHTSGGTDDMGLHHGRWRAGQCPWRAIRR